MPVPKKYSVMNTSMFSATLYDTEDKVLKAYKGLRARKEAETAATALTELYAFGYNQESELDLMFPVVPIAVTTSILSTDQYIDVEFAEFALRKGYSDGFEARKQFAFEFQESALKVALPIYRDMLGAKFDVIYDVTKPEPKVQINVPIGKFVEVFDADCLTEPDCLLFTVGNSENARMHLPTTAHPLTSKRYTKSMQNAAFLLKASAILKYLDRETDVSRGALISDGVSLPIRVNDKNIFVGKIPLPIDPLPTAKEVSEAGLQENLRKSCEVNVVNKIREHFEDDEYIVKQRDLGDSSYKLSFGNQGALLVSFAAIVPKIEFVGDIQLRNLKDIKDKTPFLKCLNDLDLDGLLHFSEVILPEF